MSGAGLLQGWVVKLLRQWEKAMSTPMKRRDLLGEKAGWHHTRHEGDIEQLAMRKHPSVNIRSYI